MHVGIAGWSYDDWKGVVYPRGCRDTLKFCLEYVDCIEINSSFYRTPSARTCASWAKRSADSGAFFTAKLPRRFTHDLDLAPSEIAAVREGFAPLLEAGRMRMWLAQFSYRFTADQANRDHLAQLVDAVDELAPVAVEVRHKSWTEPDALDWIRGLGASLAHLDYPGWQSGFGLWRTGILGDARIAYFRLHGRNSGAWFRKDAGRDEVYDYDYAPDEVRQLARRVEEIAADAGETIVVANNHFHGQGMKVALELIATLRDRKVDVPDALIEAFPALAQIARGRPRGCSSPRRSRRDRGAPRRSRQRGFHLRDETGQHLRRQVEPRPRRVEKLRERPAAAEGQTASVGAHRCRRITPVVLPDLERGDLRDPVLDVVHRAGVQVGLRRPLVGQRLLDAAVVDVGLEPAPNGQPLLVSGRVIVLRVRVHPVLERIDRCDPRQQAQHSLEVRLASPRGVVGRIHPLDLGESHELHRHARGLGELDRSVAVLQQRLVPRQDGVNGVPALVQHRLPRRGAARRSSRR